MPRTTPARPQLTLCFLLITLALTGCGQDQAPVSSADLLGQLKAQAVVPNFVDPGAAVCQPLRRGDWYPPESNRTGGTHAWTSGQEAFVSLPVADPGPGRLILVGYGLQDESGFRQVELVVNGRSLGVEAVPPHRDRIDWRVPPHTLRSGLNEVQIKVDRTILWDQGTRTLGVFVDLLQFVPEGDIPRADPYDQPPADLGLEPGIWRTARIVHGAGSTLLVSWSGESAAGPAVTLSALPGGDPLITAASLPQANQLRLDLPADLPPCCWLNVAGDGIVLKEARIELNVRPLDIVLIVVDTLRPDFLGCYGGTTHPTPAIDALAADGIRFENAVCHIPITGPSHANLFTSRLPVETRVLNNARGKIPLNQPLLAEILAERGYRTAGAVSLSNIAARYGFGRGFTEYADHMADRWNLRADTMMTRIDPLLQNLARPGFLWVHLSDPHEPYDAHGLVERQAELLAGGQPIATIPTSTYSPTRLTLEVQAGRTPLVLRGEHPFHLRNLALRKEELPTALLDPPFQGGQVVRRHETAVVSDQAGRVDLVVHVNDLLESEQEIRERYGREVAFCDRFVGAILDSLKRAGRYQESLIIFTSDHGEALGEFGELGHVETLYDVMMRVPLIIKPPRGGDFSPGSVRRDQAALVDIPPTVLARLGVPPLPQARGRDLLAAGAEKIETAVFMETHRPQAKRDLYGLRTGSAKIIHEPETGEWEFYDLSSDPREQQNLAGAQSAAFLEHQRMLLGVMASLDLTAVAQAAEIQVDERTQEALRSLGY